MAFTPASNNQVNGGAIHFGLIGAGRWGRNYVGTIDPLAGIELAWVVDPDPTLNVEIETALPVFDNWDTAIRSKSVDGVIIASPPQCHEEGIRTAVAKGLPVLVEKPLVQSAQAARDLVAFVEARGGYVLVNHIYLFHPGYRELKRTGPRSGPVTRLQSVGGDWGPFRPETPVLWDWGPHDVALSLDLVGKSPVAVNVRRMAREETPEGTGENLAIELEFEDNVLASIEIGNLFREKRRNLQATFGKQTFVLDDNVTDKLTREDNSAGHSNKVEPIAIPDQPPLSCIVQEFAEAVRANSKDIAPLKFAAQVTDVLEQCERTLVEN